MAIRRRRRQRRTMPLGLGRGLPFGCFETKRAHAMTVTSAEHPTHTVLASIGILKKSVNARIVDEMMPMTVMTASPYFPNVGKVAISSAYPKY
jgi:hypothetical protein